MFTALLLLSISGCSPEASPPPTVPVSDPEQLIAADLDGDGKDEFVAIKDGVLYWGTQSFPLSGAVIHHRVGQLGEGIQESVVMVTGRSRKDPKALPTISKLNRDGFTHIYIGKDHSERISDIRIRPQGIFITRVGNNKMAEGGWWKDNSFHHQSKAIMGLQQVPMPDGSIVVGRLYGDQPRQAGGLEIHRSSQEVQSLNTHRGVRTLEVFDLDRDGHDDLLVADGWHFKYGKEAQARLVFFRGPDFVDRRVLAEIDSAYTINAIEPIMLPSTKPTPILVTASDGQYILHPETVSWRVEKMPESTQNGAATVVEMGNNAWIFRPDGPHEHPFKP